MENSEKSSTIEQMFSVGAQYGYSRSRRHPSVKPYVFGIKNNTEILDLEKTYALLGSAKEFVRKVATDGKQIIFVGNKPEARMVVTETANAMNMPVTLDRWIGGTLTNFPEIKKRLALLEDLRAKREQGAFGVYTKKERLGFDKEIAHLERFFAGMVMMKTMPAAVFVIDPRKEDTAVREAKKMGVKIVALAGSDCNISEIDFPIVANDASVSSIKFFVNEIAEAYKAGMMERVARDEAEKESVEKSATDFASLQV